MASDRITPIMATAAILAIVGVLTARAQKPTPAPAPAAKPAAAPAEPAPLDIAWRVSLTARGAAGVGASSTAVFVTATDSTTAFAADDGREIMWTKPLGSDQAPLVTDDAVAIITSAAVEVLGFDGAPRWRAEVANVSHGIAIGQDLITVSGRTIQRWQNGRERWKISLDADPVTSPVVSEGTVVLGVKPAGVVAIDATQGQVLWTLPLPADPDSLGFAKGRLLVCTPDGSSGGFVSSYRIGEARELEWPPYPLVRCIGQPISDDKLTFAAFLDNVVRTFDAGNGHQRWMGRLPTRPAGGPIRFPDSIVVPLTTGEMAEFKLDGKRRSLAKPPADLPTLLRLLSFAVAPDHSRIYATGASGETFNARLLFAWARPKP